jgi:hypothetical protein
VYGGVSCSLGKGIGDVAVKIYLCKMRGIWAKAQPLPTEKMVQAAKALGLIDIRLCDGPIILQVLKAAAQEDGINPEDFSEFEAALVRFGMDYGGRVCWRSYNDQCAVLNCKSISPCPVFNCLAEMCRKKLGHFKHRDLIFAEDGLELGIRVDITFICSVLKAVCLDVFPPIFL